MQSADSVTLSFDTWLDALRNVCGSFDSTPLSRWNFQGSVSKRNLGGIEIAGITTNAERIVHHRPERSDDESYCFLIVQKQGSATLMQDSNKITMRPGEMVLMDSAEASEIMPHGLIEHDSFHLPRGEVMQRFGHQAVPFMKIAADCASGQIIQLIISRMLTGQLAAEGDDNSGISDSLIALLPAIHQHQSASPTLMERNNGNLYLCIQQYIDQHLHEAELSPECLAHKFHISIRQLYRLFEQRDETVCRYVQRKRLERCAEDLASPLQASRSITEIAYRWGFTDSAHFSRSFKRELATSPRKYRQARLVANVA
ncbi:transcriptional regulator FeaR [Cobetia crustatorum]|uniref:transcriptional regulator FeaR n=1 Tax=Cobetia crustatorum TaxID=553385 RepID=UPI000468E55D|nr:transcriptional regulator FeaR [Cobetia crustatorum]